MQLLLSYDRTLCGGEDIYQSDPALVPSESVTVESEGDSIGYLANCRAGKYFQG